MDPYSLDAGLLACSLLIVGTMEAGPLTLLRTFHDL